MRNDTYYVEGNHLTGYFILMQGGGIEYDLLETKQEADEICEVLNRGIGPEWDEVEAALLAGVAQ